jgi:hypothetical protein
MFPRDYFKRTGRVVGWFVVTILAILGVLAMTGKLFRAETRGDAKNTETPSNKLAVDHLYKCDCTDCGLTVMPENHSRWCSYRKWYEDWIILHKKGGD